MRHNALTLLKVLLEGGKITLEGRDYTLERTEEGDKPIVCTPMQKTTFGPEGKTETIQIPVEMTLDYFILQSEKIPESEIFIMGAEMALRDINSKKFRRQEKSS